MEINIKELRRMTRLINKVIDNNQVNIEKIHFRGIQIEKLLDTFAETVEKLYALDIEISPLIIEYYNETFVGEESNEKEIKEDTPPKIEPLLDLAFTSLEEEKVISDKPKKKPGRSPKPKVNKPKKKMGRPPKPKVDKPKKRRKTRTYTMRKLKPNSVVACIAKVVKENPKISRMEILDILEVEFPEKKKETLYVTVSQTLYALRHMLELFGINVD